VGDAIYRIVVKGEKRETLSVQVQKEERERVWEEKSVFKGYRSKRVR